jgi:hypothetical protein
MSFQSHVDIPQGVDEQLIPMRFSCMFYESHEIHDWIVVQEEYQYECRRFHKMYMSNERNTNQLFKLNKFITSDHIQSVMPIKCCPLIEDQE